MKVCKKTGHASPDEQIGPPSELPAAIRPPQHALFRRSKKKPLPKTQGFLTLGGLAVLQGGCLSGLYPETLEHLGTQHPTLGMGGRPGYRAPAVRAAKRVLGYVAGMAHLVAS